MNEQKPLDERGQAILDEIVHLGREQAEATTATEVHIRMLRRMSPDDWIEVKKGFEKDDDGDILDSSALIIALVEKRNDLRGRIIAEDMTRMSQQALTSTLAVIRHLKKDSPDD